MPNIPILYEDNHLLVVIKAAGIPAQADDSGDPDMLSLLKEYVRINEGKKGQAFLGLVHRLDRPVSGLMVFAKTSKAASRLSDQIRRRYLRRDYIALCHGKPDSENGVFIDYLTKKPQEGKVRATGADDGVRAELRRVLFRSLIGYIVLITISIVLIAMGWRKEKGTDIL